MIDLELLGDAPTSSGLSAYIEAAPAAGWCLATSRRVLSISSGAVLNARTRGHRN
jgi:hypothetical protein